MFLKKGTAKVEENYFPVLTAYPKRAAKWQRVLDYRELPTTGSLPVVGTCFDIKAATPNARGKRIAFLSDLHYGGKLSERGLVAAAVDILWKFRPDYLCLGGDIVADASEINSLPELLAELAECAPVTLAIPGNWERGKTWLPVDFWQDLYSRAGIRFLSNSTFENQDFFFYGCDELPQGTPALPTQCPAKKENILLCHRPDIVVGLDSRNILEPFRLVLCGHTHGGQIRFPLIGSIYARSCYGKKFDYGLFRHRNQHTEMIVSSGISSRSFPFRLNCRREILLLQFS